MTAPRLRLLLAEDDVGDVTSIQKALHDRGLQYPLHVVRTGDAVLLALRSGEVSRERLLVLLALPEPAGLATLSALRSDPELALLPVVLFTTASDEQSKLRAYQLNVAGYLRRPPEPAARAEQLEALCNYWAANEMP